MRSFWCLFRGISARDDPGCAVFFCFFFFKWEIGLLGKSKEMRRMERKNTGGLGGLGG